jgi:hypothetical protein
MTIAFLCVTTVIVGLRLYQRLSVGTGLFSDDYLIMTVQVCDQSGRHLDTSTVNMIGNSSSAYQTRF